MVYYPIILIIIITIIFLVIVNRNNSVGTVATLLSILIMVIIFFGTAFIGINATKEGKQLETIKWKFFSNEPDQQVAIGSGLSTENAFGYPLLNKTYVTSEFGYRIHPITNTTSFHTGIDLGGIAEGSPSIIASNNGTVIANQWDDAAGWYVKLDHGNGIQTLYAHMSEQSTFVQIGQTVTKGAVIGKIGSTGSSTAPHLHFAVKVNNEYVNPRNYVNFD